MVNARFNEAQTETRVVETSPESVTLDLTMEEAELLSMLLRFVPGSGGPACSVGDDIYWALKAAVSEPEYRYWKWVSNNRLPDYNNIDRA